MICKEVSHIFSELQDGYFFRPNKSVDGLIPHQPILWRVFSKKSSRDKIYIQIAKTKPSLTIIEDGKVC